MLLAESAVLLDLHTIGHGLLILGGVVIALLALGACQCNLCTHVFSSENIYKMYLFSIAGLYFWTKK
jgi:hypothetical protein